MSETASLWGWERPIRAVIALFVVAGSAGLLAARLPAGHPAGPPPPVVSVDLNSAPRSVLLALPGLGPARVDRIVAARDDRPFASLDDLERRVKGIGPATISGIRPYVRVGGADGGGPAVGHASHPPGPAR